MGAHDISIFGLIIGYLLLLIPVAIAWWLKIKIIKSTLIASLRMAVQLVLIGLFLEYLFKLNNPLVNISWLLVMIVVASFAMIRTSELKLKNFLLPAFASLSISTLLLLFIFNLVILDLDDIFDAKYLIAIGGMLLGNSLKADIIGATTFYKSIRRNEVRYHYLLGNGATAFEALLPHIREAFKNALDPFIASMATYGIVSLPGMMTGQILGGSSPLLAIKYQITIVAAIFVVTALSVILTILFSLRPSFDAAGMLNKDIFREKKSK